MLNSVRVWCRYVLNCISTLEEQGYQMHWWRIEAPCPSLHTELHGAVLLEKPVVA
jgi:hypothetical protein